MGSKIENLSVLIECSNIGTPNVPMLKKYIDILSAFGYKRLYLGVTEAYKIPEEPFFNYNKGGYMKEQFVELDYYAEGKGMELCLSFQTLAHLEGLSRYECFKDYMDTNSILMVGDERTYTLIDHMFQSLSESVRSRTIHIGMDEAWDLGLGKYLKKNGYHDRHGIFLEHLNRVCEIARKYNYKPEMWADMFFYLAKNSDFEQNDSSLRRIIELIPEDVTLVHWDYSKRKSEEFERSLSAVQALANGKEIVFAGGALKYISYAPHNAYSIDVISEQINSCRKLGVSNYMLTLWSDNGARTSNAAILPTLFATAELAKGKTKEEIDKDKFAEIIGVNFDSFMLLDALDNPYFKKWDENWTGTKSYYALFTDLLIPYFDLYISEGNDKAYAELAEKLDTIDGKYYQPVFDCSRDLARVLSIKAELSQRIRKAYKERNLELLRKIATKDIPLLIEYMKEFTDSFEEFWFWENVPYGIEVHHHFNGGLICRWESVAKRILKYVEKGVIIEELEREARKPEYLTCEVCEDNLRVAPFTDMISFCTIR